MEHVGLLVLPKTQFNHFLFAPRGYSSTLCELPSAFCLVCETERAVQFTGVIITGVIRTRNAVRSNPYDADSDSMRLNCALC